MIADGYVNHLDLVRDGMAENTEGSIFVVCIAHPTYDKQLRNFLAISSHSEQCVFITLSRGECAGGM